MEQGRFWLTPLGIHLECLPDSQNFHSDGAKIQTISETSKFFWGNVHLVR